jgi:hypothetical protein
LRQDYDLTLCYDNGATGKLMKSGWLIPHTMTLSVYVLSSEGRRDRHAAFGPSGVDFAAARSTNI